MKKFTANMQLVPKYCFLSDFDILNFIVFVRVKFHWIQIKVYLDLKFESG